MNAPMVSFMLRLVIGDERGGLAKDRSLSCKYMTRKTLASCVGLLPFSQAADAKQGSMVRFPTFFMSTSTGSASKEESSTGKGF